MSAIGTWDYALLRFQWAILYRRVTAIVVPGHSARALELLSMMQFPEPGNTRMKELIERRHACLKIEEAEAKEWEAVGWIATVDSSPELRELFAIPVREEYHITPGPSYPDLTQSIPSLWADYSDSV